MLNGEESSLTERILQGDKSAFTSVFTKYYADMVMFAHTMVRDKATSEEIVQDIFIRLWENRKTIVITSSLKSFLLKSIQNKCIDWIRHIKIRDKYQMRILNHPILFENDAENYLLYTELEEKLKKALDKFPKDISRIFVMNRFEGLTYNQIADALNISVRTVEVRMGKALSLLKDLLKDYLITPAILFSLFL